MTKSPLFIYHIIPSTSVRWGLVLVCQGRALQRIFLPRKGVVTRELIGKAFPGAVPGNPGDDAVYRAAAVVSRGAHGEFSLDELDFGGYRRTLPRRVLTADHAIPRRQGRDLRRIGCAAGALPGAGRAVGNVHGAEIPFPHHPLPSGGRKRRGCTDSAAGSR